MSSPGVCGEDRKSLAFVRREIRDAAGETEAVAFLSREVEPLFEASERALMAAWNRHVPAVVILLPWCSAPLDRMRNDGLVHSFLCTPSIWDELSALQLHAPAESLCFELLASIL